MKKYMAILPWIPSPGAWGKVGTPSKCRTSTTQTSHLAFQRASVRVCERPGFKGNNGRSSDFLRWFHNRLISLCQELDVLDQQIGFGLRVLPCAPTDHLYPDFRRRHKAYSKMWTESPPEETLERRTETYLISS